MPAWVPILAAVCVALLSITLTAAVNLRLKFARDSESAQKELKALAWQVARWAANLTVLGGLVYDLLRPAPVTRLTVFMISMQVATLLFVVVASLLSGAVAQLRSVVRLSERIADVTGQLGEMQGKQLATLRDVIDVMERKGD